MTTSALRHLTWARVGIAMSAVLIVFGVVDAALPHHQPTSALGPSSSSGGRGVNGTSGEVTQEAGAAQRVAEAFVAATDTTDSTHPTGDLATEEVLAPKLAVSQQATSHSVPWPEAWTAEKRRTAVVLDPPGLPLATGHGQVTVMVTGTMLVTSTMPVTSTVLVASGGTTTTKVPLSERVTLRHRSSRGVPVGAPGGSPPGNWVVTGVEAGQ